MNIQSLRSHRVFNIALFDVIGSIIGIMIIITLAQYHYRGSYHIKESLIASLICSLPLGIFFHVLSGTNTELNYKLGLSEMPIR